MLLNAAMAIPPKGPAQMRPQAAFGLQPDEDGKGHPHGSANTTGGPDIDLASGASVAFSSV